MPTETIHFDNARLVQQLFGGDSRNLQALEHQLGVKATSREGWIKLDGEPDAVARAKDFFHLLEGTVKAGLSLRSREFTQALNVVQHEGVAALKSLYAERIHTSTKKSQVVPKTTGQKKYVEAIRGESWAHHPHAPGGRGGRSAGLLAGRSVRKDRALSSSAA